MKKVDSQNGIYYIRSREPRRNRPSTRVVGTQEGHHASTVQTDVRLEMGNLYSKHDNYSIKVVDYIRARPRCANDCHAHTPFLRIRAWSWGQVKNLRSKGLAGR